MKHAALLAFITIAMYFVWRYAPRKDKRMTKRFASTHVPWVFIIVAAIFLALIAAVQFRSINIV